MIKHLYFFRHGQTDWNVQRKPQGHIDVPLNELGIQQAGVLAHSLKSADLEIIYSSDLQRASVTAQVVSTVTNTPIIYDAAWREAHIGDYQGNPDYYQDPMFPHWSNCDPSFNHIGFNNGETKQQMLDRVLSALNVILKTDHERIGISTHGFLIRILVRNLVQNQILDIYLENAECLHLVVHDGVWSLAEHIIHQPHAEVSERVI